MPFADDLPARLRDALTERGYGEPTAVQSAVTAPDTRGRDLLVSAQTGSGKTVAFGLAIAPELLGGADTLPRAGAPLALVVAPTRELALQVRTELAWLYGPAGGRVVSCVGGVDPVAERRALAAGAHVVVGTPGRLLDHIERRNLDTGSLRAVVLDEADEMLDLGFRDDLEAILGAAPAERRTLLFSATVPRGIEALAGRFQRDSLRIAATASGERHGDIRYQAMTVARGEAERALVNVLRHSDARGVLVFCNTRAAVNRVRGNLGERGFVAVALSGEMTQAERSRALVDLRDGRARVCVATDVAARGIDLPDLGLVVHAELPRQPETLLHRSGRTGRAGRKGISVLLVPAFARRGAERLLQAARVEAEWVSPPSAEAVRAVDDLRIAAQAAELVAAESDERDLALARALLAERDPEAVAAALVRTLRAPLPAPEELSTAEAPRPPRRDAANADSARTGASPGPGMGEGVWFRASVGRFDGADPRRLLPILCRMGDVTRHEIGRIRVLDRETAFEVAPGAADRFFAAARGPGEEGVRVAPADGAPPERSGPPRGARPYGAGPRGSGPRPTRGYAAPGGAPPARRTARD